MFEFLRALIPGRKADAAAFSSRPSASDKGQKGAASGSAKLTGGEIVKDRPAFGQKPKAVFKPPRQKPRAKR